VCVLVATATLLALRVGSSLTGQDGGAADETRANHHRLLPPAVMPRSSCDVGARPDYFVPGDEPAALLGCVRLPVSGQLLEFSGNRAGLDGARHLCINPAFGAGRFIPAICKLDPPVSQFSVRDAMQPRQGVGGYSYVIWGTAGTAQSVAATFEGGVAPAARLVVPPEVARRYGVARFTLFVVELPLSAACASVSIEAEGATESVEPKPRVCQAADIEAGRDGRQVGSSSVHLPTAGGT
jgi:hypothetical protein